MRRKLLCVSLAMIFGIWAMSLSMFLTVSIALAVFCYAAVLRLKPEWDENCISTLALACLIALIFGAIRVSIEAIRYPSEDSYSQYHSEKKEQITARVINAEHRKDGGVKFTVNIINCKSRRFRWFENRRCLITDTNDIKEFWHLIGTEISFSGELSIADPARNPRCFDYREYLKSKGIAYVSKTKAFKVVKDDPTTLERLKRKIYALREGFVTAITEKDSYGGTETDAETDAGTDTDTDSDDDTDAYTDTNTDTDTDTDTDTEAMVRGILFGDTSYMSDDLTEDFRRNGTAHILAVSGLHIGLLYGIYRTLRRKVPLSGIDIAFFAVLIIYGTMTLWSVSVTRAIVMVVILESGNHLNRRYDLITSLGFVSMLYLTVNPYALYGASFMMSYLAVLSLAVIGPVVKSKLPDKVPGGISASLSVQIGLAPYTCYTFNMIPLGAVIINIPVIFIMSMLMSVFAVSIPLIALTSFVSSAAIVSQIFSPVFVQLQRFCAEAISVLLKAITAMNGYFADIDVLSPDVVSPPLWALFALYGAMFTFCSESFRVSHIRKSHGFTEVQLGIALVTVMMSLVISFTDFDHADIIMVDVGQGDCMHIKAGGRNYLIDGGGSTDFDVGNKTLKPYLLKNGVKKIDAAFVTHLHTDHYKGITELAQNGMIRHLFVYDSNRLKLKEICHDTSLSPADITFLRQGHKVNLSSNATAEVLWPPPHTDEEYKDMIADESEENASSLIIKVTIDGVSLLATGDLGEEGEKELMDLYKISRTVQQDVVSSTGSSGATKNYSDLRADILKVGHHGSKTSSSDQFLDVVSPRISVIQVGKNNLYGHPSRETLERLKDHGIPVWRNDLHGAIGIEIKKDRTLKVTYMIDGG